MGHFTSDEQPNFDRTILFFQASRLPSHASNLKLYDKRYRDSVLWIVQNIIMPSL